MTTPEILRDNRLLRGCSPQVLALIAPLVSTVTVAPGTVIYQQGDAANAMYLVLEGAVDLTRPAGSWQEGQETSAQLSAGEFFGDMALLDTEPHIARATAVQTSVLGRIDRAGIEEILRLAPHVVPLNFVREVHRRVKDEAHPHFTAEIMHGDRLQHIGTMTGMIIHDFKTPLTAIQCACDLLESGDHDETYRALAEVIKRSVERMMGMTQELLDYTLGVRATSRFELVPVTRLLAGLEDQALRDLPRHGIEVELRVGYQGEVEIDVMRFERMLLNLIRNAREAMVGPGRLRLSVTTRGEWLVFGVEDTGRGMTPEVVKRIFEPFFTHAKPLGTGLGMSMVQSVVDAHRGTIRVESEPGQGTKFEVAIPLRQPRGA